MVQHNKPTSLPSRRNFTIQYQQNPRLHQNRLPLIHRHTRRDDRIAKSRDNPPHNHTSQRCLPFCTTLHRSPDTGNNCPNERCISTSEAIAEKAREEDVGGPGAEVVDGCYEAFLSGGGVVQRFDEAGIDVDGGDYADVVAVCPMSDVHEKGGGGMDAAVE